MLSERGEHAAALRELEQIPLPEFSSEMPIPVLGDEALSVALTLNNLATVNARLRRADDAVRHLRRAIQVLSGPDQRTRAVTAHVDSRLQSRLADAMSNLSTLMSEQKRDGEALSLAQQAVKLRSDVPPLDAASMQHRAIAHSNLASILIRSGKAGEAIASFQTATGLFEKARSSRPQDPLVDSRLAVTLNNFAMAQFAEGAADEAELLFHKAKAYADASISKQPDNPTNHGTAAGIMNNLGVLLRDSHRSTEARRAFDAAIQFQKMAAKLSPGKPQDESQFARIQSNLESLETAK
jgi:tetratricopeptide (TPR) repeat protein